MDNPFLITYNGNRVYLQGYNIDGSTYFKLRDIADVVGGFNVEFKNNTIVLTNNNDNIITENSDNSNHSTTLTPYDGYLMWTNDFKMGGKTYEGFTLVNNGGGYALINLEGKYTSFDMKIGSTDSSDKTYDSEVNIYLDGQKVKSYTINP